jgi:DNA-binding ferritin-like protein
MNTLTKLQDIFCDNFVAYYRAHSIHMNITGRNFYSDHKLLQKVYEELQEHIDDIGELLRSSKQFVPETIRDIVAGSDLDDSTAGSSGADNLLMFVC